MAKKIACVILVVAIVVGLIALFLFFTKPGNAVKDWFVGLFTNEQVEDQNDANGNNNGDSNNTTTPDDDKNGENGDSSINLEIEDMTQAQRLEEILKIRNQIEARVDKDREFNLQEAMIMSMHVKLDKDGKYLENGHNMPATGVETYPMSEYPGGWKWASDEVKAEDGTVKVPMFICGDKIAIYQPKLGNKEFKAADVNNLEIMLCIHENGLLSPSWERNLGEVAIVKFDDAGKMAFENLFRWWWETNDKGEKVAVVGFTYCNDAPEGVDIIPVLVAKVEKSDGK